VTEIDGKAVHSELDLRSTVSRISPGTVVTVSLVRNGEEKRLKAKIEEAPDLSEPAKPEAPPRSIRRRSSCPNFRSSQKGGLESPPWSSVKAIDNGSPTAESEVRSNDVILKINDTPTPRSSLQQSDRGDQIRRGRQGLLGGQTCRTRSKACGERKDGLALQSESEM